MALPNLRSLENLKRLMDFDRISKKHLTHIFVWSNIVKINSGTQTVEVEIKTVNALTERPVAEKGWRCRLLNGPLRA